MYTPAVMYTGQENDRKGDGGRERERERERKALVLRQRTKEQGRKVRKRGGESERGSEDRESVSRSTAFLP